MKTRKVTQMGTDFPKCDICLELYGETERATVDGCMNAEARAAFGHSWAKMCDAHHERFGVGLGTGKGQRLQ